MRPDQASATQTDLLARMSFGRRQNELIITKAVEILKTPFETKDVMSDIPTDPYPDFPSFITGRITVNVVILPPIFSIGGGISLGGSHHRFLLLVLI